MTKNELNRLRATLVRMGQRLGGEFDHISDEALRQSGGEASGSLSNLPLHNADLGSDQSEREVSLLLLENEGRILNQIRDAIERIDQGTYGRCLDCEKSIGVERLRALPYVPWCLECARERDESTPRA